MVVVYEVGGIWRKVSRAAVGVLVLPVQCGLGWIKKLWEQGRWTLQPLLFLSSVIIYLPALFYKALLSLEILRESSCFTFACVHCLRSDGKRTCENTCRHSFFLQQLFHKEGGLGHQINQSDQHWSETAGQLWKHKRVKRRAKGCKKTELQLR